MSPPERVAIAVVVATAVVGFAVVGLLLWFDYFGPFGGDLWPPTAGYAVYGLLAFVIGLALGWIGRHLLRR